MPISKAATFLKSRITPWAPLWTTGRGFFAIAAVAAVLGLISNYVVAPAYREIAGFLPFDLQYPLSRFMIGVELGTFDGATAIKAYVLFAAVHFALGIVVAALFTLFWAWLFLKVPTRLFSFLRRGGILMVPWYVVPVDLLGKIGFFRLLGGLSWPPYDLTIELCAPINRFKFAMVDIRNYLTVAFVLVIVVGILLRRAAKPAPRDPSLPS